MLGLGTIRVQTMASTQLSPIGEKSEVVGSLLFFLSISLFYHLPVAENAQISVCDCPIFIDIRSTSEKTQQEASGAFRRVTGSFPPLRNPIQYPSGS